MSHDPFADFLFWKWLCNLSTGSSSGSLSTFWEPVVEEIIWRTRGCSICAYGYNMRVRELCFVLLGGNRLFIGKFFIVRGTLPSRERILIRESPDLPLVKAKIYCRAACCSLCPQRPCSSIEELYNTASSHRPFPSHSSKSALRHEVAFISLVLESACRCTMQSRELAVDHATGSFSS